MLSPCGMGVLLGGSGSLSREPGISLALLQVEPSAGAQTQEPWLGWGLRSFLGSRCCLCPDCPNFPWDGGETVVFIHKSTTTSSAERAAQGEVAPRPCPGAGRGMQTGCHGAGVGEYLGVLGWG